MRARVSAARTIGFTLIEILIAIVVLVLGITGIVALFPAAIESGNQTVEDSYAASITQSVIDALTVGIRESRYIYIEPNTGREWTFCILNHDGVVDALPANPEDYSNNSQIQSTAGYGIPTGPSTALHDRDYTILLPRAVTLNNGVGQSYLPLAAEPNRNVDNEPYFLYPVPLVPQAEANQRSRVRIDQGQVIDNLAVTRRRSDTRGQDQDWIPRVYRLGTYRDPRLPGGTVVPGLPAGMNYGDVREEFRGEVVAGEETIATDPYPSYSYAFAIRRARIDAANTGGAGGPNGRIDNESSGLPVSDQDPFSDSLYLVRVMVFKNFNHSTANDLAPGLNPNLAIPKTNLPIRQFVTLVSL